MGTRLRRRLNATGYLALSTGRPDPRMEIAHLTITHNGKTVVATIRRTTSGPIIGRVPIPVETMAALFEAIFEPATASELPR